MKKIELIKETQEEFNDILNNNMDIEFLKIWNCKINDYSNLSELRNLIELEIFVFDKGHLCYLSELVNLKKLRLIHIPQIQDLSDISKLIKLEELSLESLPSWDSSGKTLIFNNLKPIGDLVNLKKLTLMKARVNEFGLEPLEKMKELEEFITDNTFSTYDFARLSVFLPSTKCIYFKPYHEVKYSACGKCGSLKVKLSGLSSRSIICPRCNIKKMNEHVMEFNNIRASV